MNTFIAYFPDNALAANKSMATIFNGVGSGKVIKIWRILFLNNQTVAVSGVLTSLEMRRITATSGGSDIVAVSMDSTNSALNAGIAIKTGTSDTFTDLLKTIIWSCDEPTAGGNTLDEYEMIPAFNYVWDVGYGDPNINPLVLRAGEGMTIKHNGSYAGGATMDISIEFTEE